MQPKWEDLELPLNWGGTCRALPTFELKVTKQELSFLAPIVGGRLAGLIITNAVILVKG